MSGFQVQCTTTSASESVTLPFVTGYTYDCTVDWDDGAPVSVTAWDDVNATHVYATPGTYTVEITGQADAWSVNNTHSSKLQWTDIIYWGDAVDFDGFAYLYAGFFGCSNIISLGTSKIISNGLTSLKYCFRGCSGLTGSIPDGLLDNCVLLTDLSFCWGFCNGLTGSIPDGLLDNCPLITTMLGCWFGCSGLTAIPDGLLDNCPLITTMDRCWYECSGLTGSIPDGLLDNCPLITTMDRCWYECSGLTAIPDGLLDNCPSIISIWRCWYGCTRLQISPWIFYAPGEQTTRFLNKSVDFTDCFSRSSFTGSKGQVPDLWNCDVGTGTPIKTDCFVGAGNSLTSAVNYNNIPADWGGSGYVDTPPMIVSIDTDPIPNGGTISGVCTNLETSGGSLYLCDANNLATANKVGQVITHDDTSFSVLSVDIGSFTSGTYWLYFVDSDEQITDSGFEIDLKVTFRDEIIGMSIAATLGNISGQAMFRDVITGMSFAATLGNISGQAIFRDAITGVSIAATLGNIGFSQTFIISNIIPSVMGNSDWFTIYDEELMGATVEVADGPNYDTSNRYILDIISESDDQIVARMDNEGSFYGPGWIFVTNSYMTRSSGYSITMLAPPDPVLFNGYYVGHGHQPFGRHCFGGVKTDSEPRFIDSIPSDGSTGISVLFVIAKTEIYCFSSRIQDIHVEVSENGGAFVDAYVNGAFVSPYDAPDSFVDFHQADPQKTIVKIEKDVPWDENIEVVIRVTATDQFGNEATEELLVTW
jgi:hypothetical protein